MAGAIWDRFGDVPNYVEPFLGSAAMLLARPHAPGIETVNDLDGLVANFWRAVQAVPDEVAHHADWPVNENDLHARHVWLVGRKDSLQARLEGEPDFYDARVAGWWVWGMSAWIGSGFCSGEGPWQAVETEDGTRQLVHLGDAGRGVKRKRAHLGDAGRGVNRKRAHLGNAGRGVNRQRAHLRSAGQGVNRKLEDNGDGEAVGTCAQWSAHLRATMAALADRFRRVRVCCGDWTRVCGPTPTVKQGLTAVFLDPPYSGEAERCESLYRKDCLKVCHDVCAWCREWGDDPRMRIALCGYEGEGHEELEALGWSVLAWKACGGFGSQAKDGNPNAARERIWFSPHCLDPEAETMPLFAKAGL